MGLRINSNIASLTTQRYMDTTSRSLDRSMRQLASGNKFVDSSVGAADFAIGEKLRAQGRGLDVAASNISTATNFVQVAEGGLNEQNNILLRLRELSVQSASDSYGDDERKMMDVEYQQLTKELDRIAQSATYGNKKLLSGDNTTYQFQVGPNKTENDVIKYEYKINTTASNLGIDGLDVADMSNAQDGIEKVDSALTEIGKQRASLGAIQARFNSAANFTSDQAIGIERARSQIEDTDVAKSYSDMVRGQALQQYQINMLNEANHQPGTLLRLIG